MKKSQFISAVSKVGQTGEDEFKAEYNSPELLWRGFIYPAIRAAAEATKPVTEFPPQLDTEVFRAVWDLWMTHRKKLRLKPYSMPSITFKKLLEDADNNHDTAIMIIRQSIAKNYQGLFPLKAGGTKAIEKPDDNFFNSL